MDTTFIYKEQRSYEDNRQDKVDVSHSRNQLKLYMGDPIKLLIIKYHLLKFTWLHEVQHSVFILGILDET